MCCAHKAHTERKYQQNSTQQYNRNWILQSSEMTPYNCCHCLVQQTNIWVVAPGKSQEQVMPFYNWMTLPGMRCPNGCAASSRSFRQAHASALVQIYLDGPYIGQLYGVPAVIPNAITYFYHQCVSTRCGQITTAWNQWYQRILYVESRRVDDASPTPSYS